MLRKNRAAMGLAILAMGLVLGALGVRLWANGELNRLPALSSVQGRADGRVFVALGERLFIETEGGESLSVIPLQKFGLDDFGGDFAALSDNSLILPSGPSGPLQRCSLATFSCQSLDGPDHWRADGTFKLAVDEARQRIYVADTGRHRLLMLDMRGSPISEYGGALRYPNQLQLHDGALAVADTNHHRLLTAPLDGDRFAENIAELSVGNWPGSGGHRYPMGLYVDRRGDRWAVVADGEMNDGAVFRVDADGSVRQLPMPAAADPLFPGGIGDAVLIPDTENYRIHRFALSGEREADFGSPKLVSELAALRTERQFYGRIFTGSLIALLVLAVPMLAVGLLLQRRAQHRETPATEKLEPDTAPAMPRFATPAAQLAQVKGRYIFWRRFTVLASGQAKWMGWLLLALTVAMAGMVIALSAKSGAEFQWRDPQLLLLAVLTPILLVWVFLVLSYERLHVDREGIRYTSFLSGPFRFLNALWPDWAFAWEQIDDIALKRRGTGNMPTAWYFEINPLDGRSRKLAALSWRVAGESETGLRLSMAYRVKPERIRDIVRDTALYRLLGRRGA
ncbi:hypothetical protein [Microbulbifer halophilus]|uniref:NHL repeat containing protein n=1 Tax=Microbulbifer halophilus TaxID=453963 RepID=A0ABW5EG88_9GAMM|nr:hypothetical protein [Microbulbifer halophilus]MCW8128514.1 hypothetical protein [Microbulbifer halophilus]